MPTNVSYNKRQFDLLRFGAVQKVILWSGFPYVFQILTLGIFVILTVIGWQLYPPAGVEDKLFAKTNIVNLLIWGLWWPVMIIMTVFLGRVWCMICPLELVANLTERLARSMGIKQRTLNKWLRSGALIVGLYALIQLLVAGIHLHRVPAYTSIFLLILLVGAAVVGFLFKDRAFCRGFCPVGMLLNAYGRGGMLAVRPASSQTCQSCDQKNCVLACNRSKLDGRSCPSLLNPAKLNSNSDCLVCGQCIKACQPQYNMKIFLRFPFSFSDTREKLASVPLTLFVIMVSGFVTYELCTEWNLAKEVFLWVPQKVSELLNANIYSGWIKGLWTLFIFPLLLWSVLGGFYRLFRRDGNFLDAWRKLALPMAVLISAGHMAKAVAKIASWGAFLPLALHNLSGIETANSLTQNLLLVPEVVLSKFVVSLIGSILLIVGFFFAVREARLANSNDYHLQVFPKLAVGGLFLGIILGWGIV